MEDFSGIEMSSVKSDELKSQYNNRIEKSHELAVTANNDSANYSTVNLSEDDDTLIVTRKRRIPNQQDGVAKVTEMDFSIGVIESVANVVSSNSSSWKVPADSVYNFEDNRSSD